jgi:hypothetical protein
MVLLTRKSTRPKRKTHLNVRLNWNDHTNQQEDKQVDGMLNIIYLLGIHKRI